MKRKLIILITTIILSIPAFAQLEVKSGSFKEVPGFVNINLDIQTDDNDVPYAVLKVKTENINDKQRRELLFQGDAATFIECEYKVGEVWVYLTYKATYLKISHPDLSSTEFWFPFDMQPKKGYEIVLVNKTKSDIDEQTIINLIDQRLENTSTPTQEVKPAKYTLMFVTLNGAMSNYGDLSYGLTLGSYDKMGWFASVMTNFNFKGFSSSFVCNNDLMVGAYYPDYSGKEYYTSLSVMAGFIYSISKPVALRIGAGYGVRNTVYETTDNELVKNADVSASGVDVSLGAQFKLGKCMLSLDAVTTNFKIFEAKIGVGLGF
ncbi:MAG: hypothetical protein J6P64_00980 [Bacteroidales bacterium]|nr:hypothetical protein [Bacteroidales bacterium]